MDEPTTSLDSGAAFDGIFFKHKNFKKKTHFCFFHFRVQGIISIGVCYFSFELCLMIILFFVRWEKKISLFLFFISLQKPKAESSMGHLRIGVPISYGCLLCLCAHSATIIFFFARWEKNIFLFFISYQKNQMQNPQWGAFENIICTYLEMLQNINFFFVFVIYCMSKIKLKKKLKKSRSHKNYTFE